MQKKNIAVKGTFFLGIRTPENGTLAGYSALINAYDLKTPPQEKQLL
jgi:hypothetical protein